MTSGQPSNQYLPLTPCSNNEQLLMYRLLLMGNYKIDDRNLWQVTTNLPEFYLPSFWFAVQSSQIANVCGQKFAKVSYHPLHVHTLPYSNTCNDQSDDDDDDEWCNKWCTKLIFECITVNAMWSLEDFNKLLKIGWYGGLSLSRSYWI